MERRALQAFAAERLRQEHLAEDTRASLEYILGLVGNSRQGDAPSAALPPLQEEQRVAGPLRETLAKFLDERYAEITDRDIQRVQDAYHRLPKPPKQQPEDARFMALLAEALRKYRRFMAGSAATPAAGAENAPNPAANADQDTMRDSAAPPE